MLVHEALRLWLIADADLSDLLEERIYPGFLKQDTTYPAIAYRRFDEEPVERIEEHAHAGLAMFRFRFYCTTNDANGGYDTAHELAEALRLRLHGFKATVTDLEVSPVESLDIAGCFLRSQLDTYDDRTQTHQVIADYDVWAAQDQPT